LKQRVELLSGTGLLDSFIPSTEILTSLVARGINIQKKLSDNKEVAI